jgi:pyruvate dehydrogenase E2 component (dihydrolipoamide acetyltransferase)
MRTFTLPDLGEGLADAEIVSWHVSEGDRVVADQPLVSVETEKAVVEVPAPWSGRVAKLHAAPGDIVKTGAPLADIDTEGAAEDAGAVVGSLPRVVEDAGGPEEGPDAGPRAAAPRTSRVKAAPAVRKLAEERGIDLSRLTGTGPKGTITCADVERAAGGAAGYEPLRGVRRAMARNMAQSHAEVATTNVTDEANLATWSDGEDVTMRLVRAVIAACKAEPALNAWYDGSREARLVHEKIDLGIAMNTPDGLFVPVLRDAGDRPEEDLRAGLEAMKQDIAARSVPPEELKGQTITLSNFGMIGGRYATLVVLPPQVAILGAGRITREPRVLDGKIEPCRILPLSLTFDHRAVTGAEAARFLMAIVSDLEE